MKRSRLHNNKQGSNQYSRKPKFIKGKTWLSVLAILLVAATISIPLYTTEHVNRKHEALKRSMSLTVYAYDKPELVEKPTSQQQEIINYINEVFGDDADKAFKLLSCENASLNPDAVNTAGNSPAGSRDIGIFQINEFWQQTQGKFLFNWKVNVEIAHQLFTENDNTFSLWSCSAKVGGI